MTDATAAARARTIDYLRTRAASLDAGRIRARVRAAGAELEAKAAGMMTALRSQKVKTSRIQNWSAGSTVAAVHG